MEKFGGVIPTDILINLKSLTIIKPQSSSFLDEGAI
jgi:hypothetical protein